MLQETSGGRSAPSQYGIFRIRPDSSHPTGEPQEKEEEEEAEQVRRATGQRESDDHHQAKPAKLAEDDKDAGSASLTRATVCCTRYRNDTGKHHRISAALGVSLGVLGPTQPLRVM